MAVISYYISKFVSFGASYVTVVDVSNRNVVQTMLSSVIYEVVMILSEITETQLFINKTYAVLEGENIIHCCVLTWKHCKMRCSFVISVYTAWLRQTTVSRRLSLPTVPVCVLPTLNS